MQLFQFQEVQIYSPLGVEEQVFLAELEHDSRFELKHEVSPDEPYFALNNLPYSDRVYEKKDGNSRPVPFGFFPMKDF